MNDRARVPFALVGVIVLVSSTTLAATVVTHDPSTTPTVDRAMDGANAETVTALRNAAGDAATATAAQPVTVPANTTAGRALSDDRPFRDALRLRLYLLAQQRLESVTVRRGGVVANASLPPVPATTEGYRTAIDRTSVARAGDDGTALQVEIRGVRLTAVHQGRTVASETLSPTFVVANPALFLHDRTERFQERANAPVNHPGLGQRLTARLYPIAWARGYAQYGGAPIANVVGTRHVELATNDALVAEQREVFGTADPGADRGVAAATIGVAGQDLVAAKGVDSNWTERVLSATRNPSTGPEIDRPVGTKRTPPVDTSVTVGVNGSATMAYADVIGIEGVDGVESAIERAHTVQARVRTDVTALERETPEFDRISGSWSPLRTHTTTHTSLRPVDGRSPRSDGWRTMDGASYRATVVETTTRTWQRDDELTTTRTVVERTYRVDVAVQARTAPIAGAPQGRLDGPLADATDRAVHRAVAEGGGFQTIAAEAATDERPRIRTNTTADPVVTRSAVVGDVRSLRDRTRNVTTTVPATAVGSGRANPARRLHDRVSRSHDDLRGRADRTVEARTRVAARERYLTALERRLASRMEVHTQVNDGIGDTVSDHVDPARLDGALSAPRTPSPRSRRAWTDPAGRLSLAVETGPSYLPTGAVDRPDIGARGGGTVHPLKTRNLNVFTTPHGQVAKGLMDRLGIFGSDDTSLATAAQVLAGMNESDEGYEELRSEVAAANAYVTAELTAALTAAGVPADDAEAVLASNAPPAPTALRLANGSTVDRAVAALAGRDDIDRDRLRVRLETARRQALRDGKARPSRNTTSSAERALKREFRDRLEARTASTIDEGVQRVQRKALKGHRMGSLPAGLPLAPPLTAWYATANVWIVEVNGTYERFAVSANRSDGRMRTTYVREGRAAILQHEGRSLRLGRDEHVTFETETVVVVVVPSGPRGVGDTDGISDETSPGWPPGEE